MTHHGMSKITPADIPMAPFCPAASSAGGEKILSEFAADPEMAGLLSGFIDHLPGQLDALCTALQKGRLEDVQRLAHQLKGAGGGYGYPAVSEVAGSLEAAAKAVDTSKAAAATKKLQAIVAGIQAGWTRSTAKAGQSAMKRLLLVDDDVHSLAIARARLENDQVEILCATSGHAGLETARTQGPDLILLDLDMPDMSGFEVCRTLKSDPELCMIPVLFLSGSGTPEDKVRGLDLGAVDYVTKPFDAFELKARVRTAIRTKELQDRLIEHSQIDPLTGLANRRALVKRLRSEWARRQRHQSELSFVMADIDDFKRINDTYGHSVGDQVLQAVARAIAGQCRETDLPVRYGGEEFAVVTPNAGVFGAAELAERCRREVENIHLAAEGERLRPTASFGVAAADGVPSSGLLVDRADRALYQAKAAGRNRVVTCREAVHTSEQKTGRQRVV